MGNRIFTVKVSEEVLQHRMEARRNHFMSAQMLKSQLATLEECARPVLLGFLLG
jgi:gluconate kinase